MIRPEARLWRSDGSTMSKKRAAKPAPSDSAAISSCRRSQVAHVADQRLQQVGQGQHDVAADQHPGGAEERQRVARRRPA